jgi:hypothetical protein
LITGTMRPVVGVGGDAEVVVLLDHQLLRDLVERAVHRRVLLHGGDDRLHDERQVGDVDALVGERLLRLAADLHQLGDVDVVDVGEVRRGVLRPRHRLGDLAAQAAERHALFGAARGGRRDRDRRERLLARSASGGRGALRAAGALLVPLEPAAARSSLVTRPRGPVAATAARSMPSSRARRRVAGAASTLPGLDCTNAAGAATGAAGTGGGVGMATGFGAAAGAGTGTAGLATGAGGATGAGAAAGFAAGNGRRRATGCAGVDHGDDAADRHHVTFLALQRRR